jgi:YegS/Rv2252/BmrU family lipid kinase
MMKQEIWFIINPISGGKSKEKLPDLIKHAFKENYSYTIHFTEYKGHATEIAKEATRKHIPIVCAVGGDGSIHEIGQALVNTNTALGIIPIGSGNGYARHFNIPLTVSKSLKRIKNGKQTYVDVGKINDYFFLSNAGIGFDAHIAKAFSKTKNRGFLNYAKLVISHFHGFKSFEAAIQHGSESLVQKKLLFLTLANTSEFGNGFQIAPGTNASDGEIELIGIEKMHFLSFLHLLLLSFKGKTRKHQNATFTSIKQAVITCKSEGFQIDGEFYNEPTSTYKISVLPKALKVIL